MHNSKILIVDDNPAARDTLEGLLTHETYDLIFAANGSEALAKAATLTPDLILLDVMMPTMDGFEVCRILRTYPQLAEVPIILVTALDDRDSRIQGLQAGADDFISKPFDSTELRARVQTITRLNRYRHLLTERARFAWVLEQTDDGYVLTSASDELLYANPCAQRYLSLRDDFGVPLGTRFLPLVQQHYRLHPPTAWEAWQQPAAAAWQHERYLLRPESSTAPALWLLVSVFEDSAGGTGQRLIRLRDITARLTNQREVRTTHAVIHQKLSASLWNMLLSVELLASRIQELSLHQLAGLTDAALKGVRRLRSEIEDILGYLKAPSEVRTTPGCSLQHFAALVNRSSTALGITTVSVSGHEALGDARLVLSNRAMEWIIWELLENARKFHPQQAPTLALEVERCGEQAIRLQVADDGITLTPEQLEQVWVPHYQAEKRFTGRVAGMGLGLSLVASLVWEVGGACHLFNRSDGPGIVVELVLPLRTP